MKMNTICIVDDDEVYQITSRKMIERVYTAKNILVFSNGAEAFHFLSEMASNEDVLPDVIFLDVNMPYMDAWQFLDAFGELKPKLIKQITIYVISSSVSHSDIERARSIKAVKDYYIKPITMEQYAHMLEGI